jgi:hypothetical protein
MLFARAPTRCPRDRAERTPLAGSGPGVDDPGVLTRYLYGADGRIRLGRLLPLLAVTVGLAIFGTVTLVVTPILSGHPAIRTIWVLFGVLLLKLPLILLLWWFIARNREWPNQRPRWSDREMSEILTRLDDEATRALSRPDAPARLAHLSREAWHLADQLSGERKVDALTVALKIDELVGRVRERRPQG